MTTLLHQSRLPIVDWLRPCADNVRSSAGNRWQFDLCGASPVQAAASREQGWLRVSVPLHLSAMQRPSPDMLQLMLACNAELPAAVKLAMPEDARKPCLTADVFLDPAEPDLGARVASVCDCLSGAARTWDQSLADSLVQARTPLGDANLTGRLHADLVSLCKETGWPFVQRAGNRLVFDLDVPDAFYQASAEPRGENGLHLGVDLFCPATIGRDCQLAMAVLLLHACHLVRMARATTRVLPDATQYSWEVALDQVAGSGEVDRALTALSVACRLCAREVSAIQQDACLARSYLGLRGWCS